MAKSTLISEMQKFHFGNRILCSDGEEGILTHLSFDAATRRVIGIGVKQGRFFGKSASLPYTHVVQASGDGVVLDVTREELYASHAKLEGTLYDSKSSVELENGAGKGSLNIIALHPKSGELAYVVARRLRPGQDTLLREEYVSRLEPDRIVVSIPEAVFQALPPYRSDGELQQEVENILFDLTPLHVDAKGMKLRVLDSVLYVDGNISSSLRKDIVSDQARGVRGLLEIKNNLVADDTLAGDLALALGRDPRTRDLPIGVYPRLGTVRLGGSVRNAQQKAAAEEIARSFPGVVSVVNDLQVDTQSDILPVLAPSDIADAEDRVPGKYIRHTR